VNALPDQDELISFLHREQERERSDLSRRLHDELGGLLTAVKFDAATIKRQLPAEHSAAIDESLLRLFTSIRNAVDLQRDLVEQLRPGILDHMGLFAAIRWQFESFCKQAGLSCRLQFGGNDLQINADVSIVLFRAVQDVSQSIVDRGRAREVSLRVRRPEPQLLAIEIEDDGASDAAFAATDPRLQSMQHRIAGLDGYCEFTTTPTRTLVRICVPQHDASSR